MIPQNEQGTIVLFSKLAEELGYTFKEIGTRCPDAILEKDGKPVRVEFEFRSKAFQAHKHNPDDVDLVICWEDNWPSCPVPVLSLETYVTLAHRTEEASPSLWQRLASWPIRWKEFIAEIKRICPVCGRQMDVWCDPVNWIDNPVQWVNRQCPRCRHIETECVEV